MQLLYFSLSKAMIHSWSLKALVCFSLINDLECSETKVFKEIQGELVHGVCLMYVRPIQGVNSGE